MDAPGAWGGISEMLCDRLSHLLELPVVQWQPNFASRTAQRRKSARCKAPGCPKTLKGSSGIVDLLKHVDKRFMSGTNPAQLLRWRTDLRLGPVLVVPNAAFTWNLRPWNPAALSRIAPRPNPKQPRRRPFAVEGPGAAHSSSASRRLRSEFSELGYLSCLQAASQPVS